MDVRARLDRYLGQIPDLAAAAFVAPNATVLGAVTLGRDSSVWYGSVLRADLNTIEIGEGTNIQDLAMVHLADDRGVRVGRRCTVGHAAVLHACEVGDECLVGMSATLLDGVRLGGQCIVGAGALLTPGFEVPPGSMVLGAPAKIVRALSLEERAGIRRWALKYLDVARAHASRGARA